MSPLLKKVENAGIKGIKRKRKPFHLHADDFFHDAHTARLLFSKLIDNPEPTRIALLPSVSYGMANVANNLPHTSGKIIVAGDQFPSNVYPWQKLEEKGYNLQRVAAPTQDEDKADAWNEAILKAITADTCLLAISHVHWTDGSRFDLSAFRKKLDTVGGLLVVDGTQSIGALPFSVQKIQPDAVICAAYKWLMGPYSIGLGYYGPAFDGGAPVEEGWKNRINSHHFETLAEYPAAYKEGALRYDVGEHGNFILLPMLIAGLKQVLKWTPEAIQTYCQQLMAPFIPEIQSLGYKVAPGTPNAAHLVGLGIEDPRMVEPLQRSLKKHKVSASLRGKTLRVAPHVYNDEFDIRKLLKALKEPIFAT